MFKQSNSSLASSNLRLWIIHLSSLEPSSSTLKYCDIYKVLVNFQISWFLLFSPVTFKHYKEAKFKGTCKQWTESKYGAYLYARINFTHMLLSHLFQLFWNMDISFLKALERQTKIIPQ